MSENTPQNTTGYLYIVGLGPGAQDMITPQASAIIDQATDVLGYIPYVERIADREGLVKHPTDNREEIARSRHALQLAAEGKKVVMVSSGDPGVFAMAAAVYEAVEHGEQEWRGLDIQVIPGITAMLAASASIGAPLGHDFCCINLSDNLKPWSLIDKRLRLAIEADFAIALYNPRSKSRPEGFEKLLNLLNEECDPARKLIFARAVSTPNQSIRISSVKDATADMADMKTLVIIGSSQTRVIERLNQDSKNSAWIYTPRSAQ